MGFRYYTYRNENTEYCFLGIEHFKVLSTPQNSRPPPPSNVT